MVKHSICLNYNEVTDVMPDIRITFYNAGHALGSAMVHLNIGNGTHNLMYGADMKYLKTHLLDPAVTMFPRMETLIMESTYGGKYDVMPPRIDAENAIIDIIKKTIGSATERKEVIEGGPCVVLATSGMLVGGASVEYFKHFAGNKRNSLMFVCYQGVGSLGRQVQEGLKEYKTDEGDVVAINIEYHKIDGFSAHAGRVELLN